MIVSDIVLAAFLTITLARRASGFKRTKSTAHKIILYTVNTSLLTSITALVGIITAVTMPSNLVFTAIIFVLPKLYLNSMLGLLNCRKKLREQLHHENMISIHLDTGVAENAECPLRDVENTHRKPIDIHVQIDTNVA